jgi:hypothetical protein
MKLDKSKFIAKVSTILGRREYSPMLPINYGTQGLLSSIVWFPFQGYALLCVGFPSSDVEVETQDEDEVNI